MAIDATTLEANAAMRSIVRRDTGESYQEFLTRLAVASGLKTPTREALARLDRRRKKRTSNKDWKNPFDPDAKIKKMKDGRTPYPALGRWVRRSVEAESEEEWRKKLFSMLLEGGRRFSSTTCTAT